MISAGSSHGDAPLSVTGLVLGFLSAFLWAAYWLVNNRNKMNVDGNVALFLSFLFGTAYSFIINIFTPEDHLVSTTPAVPIEGILSGMYVGAFEMGIPFVCFAMALRTTSNPALINQLSYLSPFLSLFLIAVVLGETIAITTILGLILIVAGIVLNEFVWKSSRK